MKSVDFNLKDAFWCSDLQEGYKFGDVVNLSKVHELNDSDLSPDECEVNKSHKKLKEAWVEIQNLSPNASYQFYCNQRACISHIDIDYSGQLILVGYDNGVVQMYNMICNLSTHTNDQSRNYRHKYYIYQEFIDPNFTIHNASTTPRTTVKWYPFDNDMFASACLDGRLKIWDTSNQENVITFDLKSSIYSFDFCTSPLRSSIICGMEDSTLRICDLRLGTTAQSFQYHTDKVLTVSWKPHDGYQFASGSKDKTVCVWDIRIGNRCLFCFDQDHASIPSDDNEENQITHKSFFDIPTSTSSTKPKITPNSQSSKYNKYHYTSELDDPGIVREAEQYLKYMRKLEKAPPRAMGVPLSPSHYKKRPYSSTFSDPTRDITGSHALYIRYSYDGSYLFSSGSDGMLKSWEMISKLHKFRPYGYQGIRKSLNIQFSLDHPYDILFHSSLRSWKAFDIFSGEIVENYYTHQPFHAQPVRVVKWNSQRHELYTGSVDGQLVMWKDCT